MHYSYEISVIEDVFAVRYLEKTVSFDLYLLTIACKHHDNLNDVANIVVQKGAEFDEFDLFVGRGDDVLHRNQGPKHPDFGLEKPIRLLRMI